MNSLIKLVFLHLVFIKKPHRAVHSFQTLRDRLTLRRLTSRRKPQIYGYNVFYIVFRYSY